VVLIGLGGTIAMTSSGAGGVVPTLTGEQLVAAIPGLADTGVEVAAVNPRRRPGASLTFDDVLEVAAQARTCLEGGAAGVVVTQGTDTIEETAYLWDLLHARQEPVVVTGAMRNPTLAGPDGPANLLAATAVAADPRCRGLGCLVVFNDEIHAAARVRKTHATSPATFASPDGGALGYLVENVPRLINRPTARFAITAPIAGRPRVGLYTATLADDGTLLAATAEPCDGLVVAAFGAGHTPVTWPPALSTIAARIPVVLASRTGAGSILSRTYGFAGAERDLLDRGLVPAGMLHPYKARILLHLALAAGADRDTIVAAFRAAGGTADGGEWPWPLASGSAQRRLRLGM
jgi:L-asparaginase